MIRVVALVTAFLAAIGAAPPPYKVIPVQNGGWISGRVTYVGPHVSRQEINPLTDSQVCAQHGLVHSDEMVVSSSGGLRYAVVQLVNITAGRPASDLAPTELLQNGCMFEPHVFAAVVGAPVKERNQDGILHNVHTHSRRNPAVNLAHVPSVPEMTLATFTAPESVHVTCDVHKWMSAWIWISPHPYIAVTAADGTYKIGGIPPGKYRVEIWHESLGKTFRDVTVEAGKEARVDQVLPVPTGKK